MSQLGVLRQEGWEVGGFVGWWREGEILEAAGYWFFAAPPAGAMLDAVLYRREGSELIVLETVRVRLESPGRAAPDRLIRAPLRMVLCEHAAQ